MIINDNKGGKERVTNGKIFDEDIIIDTNNSTIKQNILTTTIIVAKASNVSVNNTDDYIVKHFLDDKNNKNKIEREEENKETDDIKNQKSSSKSNNKKEKTVENTFHYKSIEDQSTMIINDNKWGKERVVNGTIFAEDIVTDTNNSTLKQNILTTSIVVDKASNISINNADDYIVKNFLHDINNKHKIEREEEKKDTDDIYTIKQESSSASNEGKGKIVANTFNYKSI